MKTIILFILLLLVSYPNMAHDSTVWILPINWEIISAKSLEGLTRDGKNVFIFKGDSKCPLRIRIGPFRISSKLAEVVNNKELYVSNFQMKEKENNFLIKGKKLYYKQSDGIIEIKGKAVFKAGKVKLRSEVFRVAIQERKLYYIKDKKEESIDF